MLSQTGLSGLSVSAWEPRWGKGTGAAPGSGSPFLAGGGGGVGAGDPRERGAVSWAAVEPAAAIAPCFPGVGAVMSWRRFCDGCVPERSVWGTAGTGLSLHGHGAPHREPG